VYLAQSSTESQAGPKGFTKPLTANLNPRSAAASIQDTALAALIAKAKGSPQTSAPATSILAPELQPSWVKVRAYYDDLWQTPFSGNPIKVWVNKTPTLMNQPLNAGSKPNSSASSLP